MPVDPRQHDIWAAERTRRRFNVDDEQFGAGFLAGRLNGPGVVVTVLPAEPRAAPFDLHDLVNSVPGQFTGQTANGVSVLHDTVPTADCVVKASEQDGKWKGYAAVYRNGGAEVGIGAPARYEESGVTVYHLYALVHAVRTAVETQSAVVAGPAAAGGDLGPFELIVSVPATEGAALGGRAAGWQNHAATVNEVRCVAEHVQVRVHVDTWPETGDAQAELVERVGDRICNGFGHLDRLHAPPSGPGAGVLDRNYA